MDNKCLDTSVVYKCNIKTEDPNKEANYIDLTEGTFKTRYYQHRNSQQYGIVEVLLGTKKLWQQGHFTTVHWSIVDHANPYVNGSNKCDLCITEKYHIITSSIDLLKAAFTFTYFCT